MYQSEHNGQYPAGNGRQVANLLLQYSDAAGANTSRHQGHRRPPRSSTARTSAPSPPSRSANKGANGIAVSSTSGVAATGGAGIAWLYNSVDGTFQAYTGTITTDSAGKLYSSY